LNKERTVSFLIAAGLGALIWFISPFLTGVVEPWDAESPYYFVSLLVAGALVGVLVPNHLWAVLLGIVVGQLIYMLVFLPSGPLLALGVVFLVGYGFLALLGALVTSRLRKRNREITGNRQTIEKIQEIEDKALRKLKDRGDINDGA
jgi:hypothetical protein